MNCASTKLCSQSCVWKAKCRHIKCSASTCNQVCTNCTMECVKGVERCDQMCLGGECRMECFAQHCKRQCSKGKCYYIGQSQSKAPIIYDWIWIFTTVAFMLLLNTWKIHNQLRKQPTFREATTSFAAKWSLSNEMRTSASDWLKQIQFNQSKALPRSGYVISMEFLYSFFRRHFAGKPVVVALPKYRLFSQFFCRLIVTLVEKS